LHHMVKIKKKSFWCPQFYTRRDKAE